jgi:hypothetical protein
MNNLDLDEVSDEALSTDGDVVFASAYVDVLCGFVFGELETEEGPQRINLKLE